MAKHCVSYAKQVSKSTVICKKEDAKKRIFLYNKIVLLLNTFTIWIERGGAVSNEQSGSIL